MNLTKNIKLGLLALVLPFFAMSCSEETTTTPTPTAKANVMVIHASPDAPGVILNVDSKNINTAATAYTFLANTPYLPVDAGKRNFQILVASSGAVAINAPGVDVAANKNYSIFAVDVVSKISPLVVEDNLATPASGQAHIRFFHLSPDAPAVDIVNTANNTKLFSNRSFNKTATASDAAFTPVPAGTYNLSVRTTAGAEVLPLNNIVLTAGKIYTVYANGFAGATGSQAPLSAKIITNN